MARDELASPAAPQHRFQFGANWTRFLRSVGDAHIEGAIADLSDMLGMQDLDGVTFLDAGSGSGLSSLAAYRMGARVTSFDLDPESVACTTTLQSRFGDEDRWNVTRGSVLDESFLERLGSFDIVYSWGVLHHTGAMWNAIDNVSRLVKEGGLLFIAIYNDQGWKSRVWGMVKRAYNASPGVVRALMVGIVTTAIWGLKIARDALKGHPLQSWREYHRFRGMSPVTDVIDWVGGYPFEVSTPEEIVGHLRTLGFEPVQVRSVAPRLGCNQFVFRNRGA